MRLSSSSLEIASARISCSVRSAKRFNYQSPRAHSLGLQRRNPEFFGDRVETFAQAFRDGNAIRSAVALFLGALLAGKENPVYSGQPLGVANIARDRVNAAL